MNYEEVRFDCKHFRGGIPCKPNKEKGQFCSNCPDYTPISKRILIIKLGALGDVIRTTPLLVRYKEMYPQAHITWLTLSPAILPKNEIDVIYPLDAASLFAIQHQTYDIAINLDKEVEACLLLAKVDATEKYGYTWKNGHLAAATPAAEHKLMTGFFDELSQKNTKSYLEEIFEICHLSFDYEPYLINLNTNIAATWKEKINAKTNRKIVGLNTGCGPRWNTRLWSDEAWKKLAELLLEKGYFPIFLGGELEHEKNMRFQAETGSFYPGHFSLEEFIALTNATDLVVTQVSMMMHIATALQKKMILMNNIFNPHEFELYGRGEIVGPPNPCICYYGNTCQKGTSCMHDIEPETIADAVDRHLKSEIES